MTRRRLLLLIMATCALTGCLNEQKRQTAQCALQARQHYPDLPDGIFNSRGEYERRCMEAAGYQWTPLRNACPYTLTMMQNPYCYLPTGPIERVMTRAEIALGR